VGGIHTSATNLQRGTKFKCFKFKRTPKTVRSVADNEADLQLLFRVKLKLILGVCAGTYASPTDNSVSVSALISIILTDFENIKHIIGSTSVKSAARSPPRQFEKNRNNHPAR
jgi:hypothetical protein